MIYRINSPTIVYRIADSNADENNQENDGSAKGDRVEHPEFVCLGDAMNFVRDES